MNLNPNIRASCFHRKKPASAKYNILKIQVILICIIVFVFGRVYGGNSDRKGMSGALELTVPVGSRSTAMGGSVVADTKGTEAIYWNPAGVSNMEGTEITFSYLDYIADIKYSFIGITTNLGNFGSLGFNTRIMNIGEIIVTTEENPDGTGEIITPSFIIVGFTYSRQMTDKLFFGSSVSLIHERIMQMTGKGTAFDFGFQYIPGISGLKLGVVVKNIGPKMSFDGSDLNENILFPGDEPIASHRNVRLELASFEIPSYIQFGSSYTLKHNEQNRIIFAGSFRNNNFSGDEFSAGVEYSYKETLMLRGGYTASSEKEYIYGLNFGFGLRFDFGGNILNFDYSNMQTKYFTNNQWFTMKFNF